MAEVGASYAHEDIPGFCPAVEDVSASGSFTSAEELVEVRRRSSSNNGDGLRARTDSEGFLYSMQSQSFTSPHLLQQDRAKGLLGGGGVSLVEMPGAAAASSSGMSGPAASQCCCPSSSSGTGQLCVVSMHRLNTESSSSVYSCHQPQYCKESYDAIHHGNSPSPPPISEPVFEPYVICTKTRSETSCSNESQFSNSSNEPGDRREMVCMPQLVQDSPPSSLRTSRSHPPLSRQSQSRSVPLDEQGSDDAISSSTSQQEEETWKGLDGDIEAAWQQEEVLEGSPQGTTTADSALEHLQPPFSEDQEFRKEDASGLESEGTEDSCEGEMVTVLISPSHQGSSEEVLCRTRPVQQPPQQQTDSGSEEEEEKVDFQDSDEDDDDEDYLGEEEGREFVPHSSPLKFRKRSPSLPAKPQSPPSGIKPLPIPRQMASTSNLDRQAMLDSQRARAMTFMQCKVGHEGGSFSADYLGMKEVSLQRCGCTGQRSEVKITT